MKNCIVFGYLDWKCDFRLLAIIVRKIAMVIMVIGCILILWNTCSRFLLRELMFIIRIFILPLPMLGGLGVGPLLPAGCSAG